MFGADSCCSKTHRIQDYKLFFREEAGERGKK
jgi:hypothetical protein